MRNRAILAILPGIAAMTTPAAGETVDAAKPETVVTALFEAG